MENPVYHLKNKKGQDIFAQAWLPEGKPRALICHIHGQSDYSSRYEHVAAFFNEHQIAFYSADLIGHGLSEGKRGHINHYDEYLETVDQLIGLAQDEFPGTPLFVYGHSMGGTIALHHNCSTNKNIKGYIITSPLIRLAFEPPAWKVAMGKKVKSIFPALSQPTGLDVRGISRDPDVVNKYANDKLVHGKITVAGFFEIFSKGREILKNADQLKYPVLLMHGTGDKVTSHLATRELAAMRKDLITYKEYEGLYHEMHNEPEQNILFRDMLNWINQQLK